MHDINCPICALKVGESSIAPPPVHLCNKPACRTAWAAIPPLPPPVDPVRPPQPTEPPPAK